METFVEEITCNFILFNSYLFLTLYTFFIRLRVNIHIHIAMENVTLTLSVGGWVLKKPLHFAVVKC